MRENVEDLGMDPEEALQDAIQALTLQGVDLSGSLSLASAFSLFSPELNDRVSQVLSSAFPAFLALRTIQFSGRWNP